LSISVAGFAGVHAFGSVGDIAFRRDCFARRIAGKEASERRKSGVSRLVAPDIDRLR
jgi:hypothetical protein